MGPSYPNGLWLAGVPAAVFDLLAVAVPGVPGVAKVSVVADVHTSVAVGVLTASGVFNDPVVPAVVGVPVAVDVPVAVAAILTKVPVVSCTAIIPSAVTSLEFLLWRPYCC